MDSIGVHPKTHSCWWMSLHIHLASLWGKKGLQQLEKLFTVAFSLPVHLFNGCMVNI